MFNPIPIKHEGKIIGYSIGGDAYPIKENYHYVAPLLTVVSQRNQVVIRGDQE